MRSRILPALLLGLAGCSLEHGNVPPERASSAARSPHARADSAGGPLHAVFDRRQELVAPGVARITVSVVLRADGREAVRAALEAVADDARRDTSVGAVRVLGFMPPAPGHGDRGGPGMVPFAYLEWIPAGGWDDVTARTAREAHHTDVVFVEDLKAHPGMPGSGRREGPE
jgi:hypothetical protein